MTDRYRIAPLSEQHAVSEIDVLELWTGEAGLALDEARRRLAELLLVASDERGRLVGMSTAFLRWNDQLRAELWHYRTFVAAAHRQSNVAASMAVAARDRLVERFASGADRRGIGILYTVQSELLKRHVPHAVWPQTRFVFIGENGRGDHVRVYYFPGAVAPEPPP